jgi:hypothetical protein
MGLRPVIKAPRWRVDTAPRAAFVPAAAAATGSIGGGIGAVFISAATCADSSRWRFSITRCNSAAALELLGLMATICRRQSSRSASLVAMEASQTQACSLRGSAINTR